MEDISLSIIFTAIAVVAINITTNWITILWIKSDMKKHEVKHSEYVRGHRDETADVKTQLKELYERTNHIMRRSEIEGVVKHELGPIQRSIDMLSKHMDRIALALADISTQIAVMNALSEAETPPRK